MSRCRARGGPAACKAGARCPDFMVRVAQFIVRDGPMGNYYAATDVKHFSGGVDVPGSKFMASGLNNLDDVVALALMMKKDLAVDDDRQEFIDHFGCSSEDFLDNYRYLRLSTPGTVGAVRSDSLSDDTVIDIVRTKPGSSCSFVVAVDAQPWTDTSVLIVTDHSVTGVPMVITAFPGVPTKPVADERVDELEGSSLTVGEAKKLLGRDSFWVNTKKV